MKELAAVLILLIALLAVVVLATRHDPHPLLLDASLAKPACTTAPPLPNPCDRVNCNRPDTRRLA